MQQRHVGLRVAFERAVLSRELQLLGSQQPKSKFVLLGGERVRRGCCRVCAEWRRFARARRILRERPEVRVVEHGRGAQLLRSRRRRAVLLMRETALRRGRTRGTQRPRSRLGTAAASARPERRLAPGPAPVARATRLAWGAGTFWANREPAVARLAIAMPVATDEASKRRRAIIRASITRPRLMQRRIPRSSALAVSAASRARLRAAPRPRRATRT